MPTPKRATPAGLEGPAPPSPASRITASSGAGGGGFPTAVKLATQRLDRHRQRRRVRAAAPQGQGADAPPRRRRCCAASRRSWGSSSAEQGIIGIKNKYTAVQEALAPQLPAGVRILPLTRHLPGRRRVPAGLRRHRPRHPARRPAEGRRRGGGQRRDTRQHRPRPARHAQVPDGGRRGPHAGHAARAGRHPDRRPDRGGRRGDRRRRGACCSAASMMGRLAASLDEPVTKTLGGVVVLPVVAPADRVVSPGPRARSSASAGRRATSAASAPSCARATCSATRSSRTRAMRSLGFDEPALADDRRARCTAASATCAACTPARRTSIPKNVCTFSKPIARERELQWKGNPADVQPHPLADSRRAPMRRLIAKLGLSGFDNVGPLEERALDAAARGPAAQAARGCAGGSRRDGRRARVARATWSPRRRRGRSAPGCTPASTGIVRAVDDAIVIEA